MAKRQWVTSETALPPALGKESLEKKKDRIFHVRKDGEDPNFFVGKQKSAWQFPCKNCERKLG